MSICSLGCYMVETLISDALELDFFRPEILQVHSVRPFFGNVLVTVKPARVISVPVLAACSI
eukprot:SAG11_NODE_390_length_9860_cov_49.246184_2_plen_62_part_00